jgi:hypothetical protein
MATKKALTDEELLAQFEGLGNDDASAIKPSKAAASRISRPTATATAQPQSEADLLAELDNLAQDRPKSRPQTPRAAALPVRTAATPPPVAARASEDKAPVQSRKSGESTRSFHQSFTPAEVADQPPAAPVAITGGGWWGGLVATASAAVKQAEALAKEIQKNEEAQRWAEQVKGNVGALRGLGIRPDPYL